MAGNKTYIEKFPCKRIKFIASCTVVFMVLPVHATLREGDEVYHLKIFGNIPVVNK
jgi:hypothetical protein